MKNKVTLQAVLDVFLPLLIYYLASSIALYLLGMTARFLAQQGGIGDMDFLENTDVVNVADNAIAMMVGAWFLRRHFLQETCCGGQSVAVKPRKLMLGYIKEGFVSLRRRYQEYIPVLILAITASMTLNLLAQFGQVALYSQTYQEVAAAQYAVPFLLGLFAYGMVSPIAEEMVFRGVLYHKCKRYLGVIPGILLSSLLFGILHGNVVQGIYAFFMGLLISAVYERYQSFFVPVLFHAAANLSVYITFYFGLIKTNRAAVINCFIFATISIPAAVFIYKSEKS